MNITIITLTFPPEPAQHILDLARGLQARGHQVTVLTSLPSYPHGRVYESYRWKLIVHDTIDGVRVVRLPVLPSHARSFLRRGVYYLSNAFSILLYNIGTIFRHSDVTVVYHPPLTTAIPALVVKGLTGNKYVHWIHDMWPETLEVGGVRNQRVLRLLHKAANYVYKHASHIMVLSDGFKQNLIDKGVPASKVSVIPNWANPDDFPLLPNKEENYNRIGLDPRQFHVLYAGNLGEMQALDSVVEAMSLLRDDERIIMLFLGSGTREYQLKSLAAKYGVESNIRFLGRVTPEQVNLYYSAADTLLVHIKDTKLFQITIPHKIYEYMMAAKPIIAAIKGYARTEVLSARAGFACDPENPAAIADAIRRMIALTPGERSVMGMNGRVNLIEHRSPELLIDRIESILVDVVSEKGATQEVNSA